MRIIVVGSAEERGAIRDRLARQPPEIVAEFESIAEARQAAVVADAVLSSLPTSEEESDELAVEELTPREAEVLELVARGLPNKAIAAELDISDQTVKFHLASISGKLGAANRTDAVRRAVRRGLIAL